MSRDIIEGERLVIVTDSEGKQLEKFKFNLSAIRSVKGLLQGLWSLNDFSQGMSRRNGFSDIDAHTEIDGRSLILEFKQSLRGMNQGQVLKAIRMAKYQKTCTWFIEGETDSPKRVFQVNEKNIEGEYYVSEIEETDIEHIRESISRWEKWSRANSLVKGNKTEEWDSVRDIIGKARIK